MKKLTGALILVAFTVLFASCTTIWGSGVPESTTHALSGFDSVLVDAAFSVYIDNSNTYSVVSVVDQNLVQYLDIKVVGTTLNIAYRSGISVSTLVPSTVTIGMPDIERIEVRNASSCNLQNFTLDNLTLVVASASTLRYGSLSANSLSATVTDASSLRTLNDNLSFQSAVVNISNASTAYVPCNTAITGSISGASTLRYHSPDPLISVPIGSSMSSY